MMEFAVKVILGMVIGLPLLYFFERENWIEGIPLLFLGVVTGTVLWSFLF